MADLESLIHNLIEADTRYHSLRVRIMSEYKAEKTAAIATLRKLLLLPHQRAAALRLISFFDTELVMALFKEIVSLAFFGLPEVLGCRRLLAEIPKDWFTQYIKAIEAEFLAEGTYSEYRRGAELYRFLGYDDLLESLLRKAAEHEDPDIKEVAEDFGLEE